jgi:phage-related protein
MAVIRYALELSHPEKHPLLIQDLLGLALAGKMSCVSAIIELITDLYHHGDDCRYTKGLGGSLFELKKRAKDGGARVYYFRGSKKEFILCHAECKRETEPERRFINATAKIVMLHRQGQQVYQQKQPRKDKI